MKLVTSLALLATLLTAQAQAYYQVGRVVPTRQAALRIYKAQGIFTNVQSATLTQTYTQGTNQKGFTLSIDGAATQYDVIKAQTDSCGIVKYVATQHLRPGGMVIEWSDTLVVSDASHMTCRYRVMAPWYVTLTRFEMGLKTGTMDLLGVPQQLMIAQ